MIYQRKSLKFLKALINKLHPLLDLGWANRLKSSHFHSYARVSKEFSTILDIDHWLINPFFDQCSEVNFLKKEGEECLVNRADDVLRAVQNKYAQYHITEKPFLAIKADSGTYGMAVMMIQDSVELRHLNRKQRIRMSASKGGVPVTKAIVQEGVYTFETVGKENAVAEPVIYLFGRLKIYKCSRHVFYSNDFGLRLRYLFIYQ